MTKHKRQRNSLRVLTYHRVADPDQTPLLHPRLVSATPAVFAKQMKYLSGNYQVVSMQEVLDCLIDGKALPERATLITFDDAYFDFEQIAWPILKEHRLPSTIFVPTAYPDQPHRCFWWDRLYAAFTHSSQENVEIPALGSLSLSDHEHRLQSLTRLQAHVKTLPYDKAMNLVDEICERIVNGHLSIPSAMSWEQLRGLANNGVTLGAHTRTHPILTQLPLEGAREEIKGSYEDLLREVRTVFPVFAYPNGDHNDNIVRMLREEGFRLAFTGLDGVNNMISADPLRLCRTDITRRTTPLIFRFRLQNWFTHIDKWRHRKRRQIPDNFA